MHGMRHLATPGRGRSNVLLSSVLALLALACVPVFAQAASVPQYEVAEPSATGGNEIPTRSKSNSPKRDGGTSETGAGGSNESSGAGTGSSDDGPSSGAGEKQGAGSGAGNGQGRGGDASGRKRITPLATQATSETDDGGSSPLVPILVAAAILAAISVGAVSWQRRRQDPDASVSPKAS
jgi:cobalamin biosynthesis Mg chelatase CobN